MLAAARAGVCWDRGDHAAAEAQYAEVLRGDPLGASVRRVRSGEIFSIRTTGTDDAAGPGPARAIVWDALGRRRFEAGDLPGAEAAVAAVLANWPESEVGATARARLAAARGRPDEAFRQLAPLVAAGPGMDDVYVCAARFAIDAGRVDEAQRTAAVAVARWPFVPRLWALVEECAREAGDVRLARLARARAVDLDWPGG